MEIKINQQKTFDKKGYVYQRGFNIDLNIFNCFINFLRVRTNKEEDYYKKTYLNAPLKNSKNCYFMNLTQTDLFIEFLKINNFAFNEKRANIKANGYLIVKGKE